MTILAILAHACFGLGFLFTAGLFLVWPFLWPSFLAVVMALFGVPIFGFLACLFLEPLFKRR